MPIDPDKLLALSIPDVTQSYAPRDVILYALGLGLGLEADTETALPFVYEPGLRVLPTLAAALAFPAFWVRDLDTGIDFTQVVHGAESLRLHRPLATRAAVIGRTRVTGILDKGAGNAAVVHLERHIIDADGGALLATCGQTIFCRGAGGFGGRRGGAAPAPPMPSRPADRIVGHATSYQTALLYRLSGDANPLHADPAVARAAGFPRPILHGLATYGIAGYAILSSFCDGDPSRFKAMSGRFSAPVFPGETLRTEMWREGLTIAFRVVAQERGAVAMDHGWAEIEE